VYLLKRKTQRIIFPGKKLIILNNKKDLPANIFLTGLLRDLKLLKILT